MDGSLLGLGLGGSGLTLTKLEYSNGATWADVPVADSDGRDADILAVRFTPSATFNATTSFELRYRVLIRQLSATARRSTACAAYRDPSNPPGSA